MTGPVMWPAKLPAEVSSSRYREAEVKVWNAFNSQLGSGWTVFYSRPWLGLTSDGSERDGECDFIVAHPQHGVLALEVKGGGISYEPQLDSWWSRDRDQIRHAIKNPVEQARKAKHELLARMKAQGNWNSKRFVRFRHGVIFPDLTQIPGNLGMDKPRDIFCCRTEMKDIASWISARLSGGDEEGPGHDGIKVLEKLLAAPIQLKVPLGNLVEDDEEAIAALTPGQFRILSAITALPRIAVGGGAGTGKTIVAFEDAVRLAEQGRRVAFICASAPLADALAERARNTSVDVWSLGALCRHVATASGIETNSSGSEDEVSEVEVEALISGGESNENIRYDAIIVDEAQDFRTHWWVAIDAMLKPDAGLLHAFYDTNQSLYGDVSSQLASFKLLNIDFNYNLRNTKKIHAAASCHYRGLQINADGPDGGDVVRLSCDASAIAATVAAEARRLILHENLKPADIAILTTDANQAAAVRNAMDRTGTYVSLVDTILRFKGLERPVVIVAADSRIADEKELAYVALSRARTHLVLVGEERVLNWLGAVVEGERLAS